MKQGILILLIMGALLHGCVSTVQWLTAPGLTEGTVTEKEYQPASSLTTYVYITTDGTSFMLIPAVTQQDERWRIVIKGQNSDGDNKSKTLTITKTEFDKLNVGDTYKIK